MVEIDHRIAVDFPNEKAGKCSCGADGFVCKRCKRALCTSIVANINSYCPNCWAATFLRIDIAKTQKFQIVFADYTNNIGMRLYEIEAFDMHEAIRDLKLVYPKASIMKVSWNDGENTHVVDRW